MLFIYLPSNNSFAQSTGVSDYPEVITSDFLYTSNALRRLDRDQSFSANLVHQRYTQLLNDIYLVNFSSFVKMKTKHQLGIIANSYKEGPYIGKSRGYIHYAYNIRFIKEAILSMGGAIGLASINYNGTTSGTGNLQDNAPVFDFDLLLQHPRYFISYFMKQASSSRLEPSITPIRLRRFHEFRIGTITDISPYWTMTAQIHSLIYTDRNNLYGGSIVFKGMSLLSFGIATYNFNTMTYQAGVYLSENKNWNTLITGSYRQSIGTKTGKLYYNTWEIGLCLSKKVKKDVHDE